MKSQGMTLFLLLGFTACGDGYDSQANILNITNKNDSCQQRDMRIKIYSTCLINKSNQDYECMCDNEKNVINNSCKLIK